MPLRTASISRRIEKNGAALHVAMMQRVHSRGEESEPSERERALAEERHQLKEEKTRRHEQALQPHAKPDKLVRTHHAEPKDKPKARKEPKESKDAKPGKPKPSRAEKQAIKAAALAAAKQAARRKPAKA